MSWPHHLAYERSSSWGDRPPNPFVVRTELDPLHIVIDPGAELDSFSANYFDMLRSRSEPGATFRPHDPPKIEFLTVDPRREARAADDVWSVEGEPRLWFPQDKDPALDGCYEVVRYDGGVRKSAGYTFPRVGQFARMLADQHRMSMDEALPARLSYEIAKVIKADLFVTTREPVGGWRRSDRMFACTPSQALSAVGLYQRMHRRLALVGNSELALWQAETVVVEAFVPRLREIVIEDGLTPTAFRAIQSLRISARQRLERVFHDRDHLLLRTIVPDGASPFAGAATLVEQMAVNLVGAFDALARAVNLTLTSPVTGNASFGNRNLRRELAPAMKNSIQEARVVELLNLLGHLRNTIHHQALGTGSLVRDREPEEPVAWISLDEIGVFRESYQRLGGLAELVTDMDIPSDTHSRTGILARPFMDEMLRRSIVGVNAILSAAPWASQPSSSGWCEDPSQAEPQLRALYGL